MVFHPIIALHAHVGGYVFRKTFVETSFKMNALIKLSLNFTADKIGKTFFSASVNLVGFLGGNLIIERVNSSTPL